MIRSPDPSNLHVNVAPGVRRNQIVGKLGDALKVHVSAPPERGKANDAVIKLIADTLGLRADQVSIVRGHANPRKTLQIEGIEQAELDARISGLL